MHDKGDLPKGRSGENIWWSAAVAWQRSSLACSRRAQDLRWVCTLAWQQGLARAGSSLKQREHGSQSEEIGFLVVKPEQTGTSLQVTQLL